MHKGFSDESKMVLNEDKPQPKQSFSIKGNRRRRIRCKNCETCLGSDCLACIYCQDQTKYGGPGKMKQACEKVSYRISQSVFIFILKVNFYMIQQKKLIFFNVLFLSKTVPISFMSLFVGA